MRQTLGVPYQSNSSDCKSYFFSSCVLEVFGAFGMKRIDIQLFEMKKNIFRPFAGRIPHIRQCSPAVSN